MIRLLPLSGDVTPAIRRLGWDWAVEDACAAYLAPEAVTLTEQQAEELLQAADSLYEMYVQAVPDNLPDDFLQLMGIPQNLWSAVRHSWNDERHWHLYGRFDLAATAEGPKLVEFNADTATSIPETAVVQWASLMAAGQPEDQQQANGLFEGLELQLREWRELNQDLAPNLLLVYLPDSPEDETNCAVLAEAARGAGFGNVHICPVDEMHVSVQGEERGAWAEVGPEQWQQFQFIFKLVPWEILAEEEPELTADLSQLLQSRDLIIANPPYALLFQSKAMLAWLWQVFPHHPLLTEAAMEDLSGHYVRKPLFGREGQNLTEVQDGRVQCTIEGDYGQQPLVRQRWLELPADGQGRQYQAGVFWAGEACAVGFRREKGMITNLSEFVPHIITG
jgi:glutathionylspermidine synthase